VHLPHKIGEKKRNPTFGNSTIKGFIQGVFHNCGLAIYMKKYLTAKEEELWKLKYFTMQKYNLQ